MGALACPLLFDGLDDGREAMLAIERGERHDQ